MSKHTPGPWRVEDWQYPATGREHVPTVQTDTDAIAEALPLWHDTEDREAERLANARLIAAAPELLEALQECVTDENAACIVQNDVAYMIRRFKAINDIARAAIAEAGGNA